MWSADGYILEEMFFEFPDEWWPCVGVYFYITGYGMSANVLIDMLIKEFLIYKYRNVLNNYLLTFSL